ncbi:hypothetical protein A2716_00615 [candidate division WWE3 bacterium RIFCSPHIGHO2_01_FULL_40_23]|uniref:Uncharacterized protein n=1 Tax=candidate division WWE3 bacterium RIFCSPLOWO2_01_FULL_41_18 TaxID=1802625 RepID=A0A1F4VE13_UNCKA|nr:MAG: hypothetical protein A2716_00615 [candidate division WWE3 bacterium RIFCSPHIGHO2_01_FULL_40_23]OGC55496.1 MAG: hypothetical protein A3A78_00885 [candidate division WWE3 bacterium RIFCSPLOWO2_01_FULL_41_18]
MALYYCHTCRVQLDELGVAEHQQAGHTVDKLPPKQVEILQRRTEIPKDAHDDGGNHHGN